MDDTPPLKPVRPHWTSGDPPHDELRLCACHEFCRTHRATPTAVALAALIERRNKSVMKRMAKGHQKKSP